MPRSIAVKRTRAVNPTPRGAIVYRGPSLIDGEPIVVVVTGIRGSSRNSKTSGARPLAQSYIVPTAMLDGITGSTVKGARRADYHAWTRNLRGGCDAGACGSCGKRPALAAGVDASSLPTDPCYVRNGPPEVARAIVRGAYPDATPAAVAAWIADAVAAGRIAGVRAGAWGDPAAAPLSVHAPILDAARNATRPTGRRGVATAYTRRWVSFNIGAGPGGYVSAALAPWRAYAMASAHTVAEAELAVLHGWRPFLVVDPRLPGEIDGAVSLALAARVGYLHCPASRERAADVGCADCGACNGGTGPIVAIASHGHYTRGAAACAAADSMLARVRAAMRARQTRAWFIGVAPTQDGVGWPETFHGDATGDYTRPDGWGGYVRVVGPFPTEVEAAAAMAALPRGGDVA